MPLRRCLADRHFGYLAAGSYYGRVGEALFVCIFVPFLRPFAGGVCS